MALSIFGRRIDPTPLFNAPNLFASAVNTFTGGGREYEQRSYRPNRADRTASNFVNRGIGGAGQTGGQAPGGPGGSPNNSTTNNDNSFSPGTTNSAPSQEQIDAQRAAELRRAIAAKRNRLNALFDTLAEDVDKLITARRGELDDQYNREVTDAREGFQTKSDELVRTFAGRGLADSSYRIEGEANAATQFRRALDELGRQNQSAQAELGQSGAEKRAAIRADRESLGNINLDDIKDDVSGLTSARNQIDKMLIEANKQRASLRSPRGYRQELRDIAPAQGQAQALKGQLDALIQANVPDVVKDSIASGLIANFGGVDEEVWNQYYQSNKAAPQAGAPPTTQPAAA